MEYEDDIAPELYERLSDGFEKNIEQNKRIGELKSELSEGGTFRAAEEYAYEVGKGLSDAFKEGLSSDVLPDGRLYYNIAKRTVEPLMKRDYEIVSEAAVQAMDNANMAAGLHIKVKTAELNTDRISKLIDIVSDADRYDDVADYLDEKVVNFSQNVVDETIKANADFHAKAGLNPKIVREAEPKCCEWCSALNGTFPYPAPDDVYRRHGNCRCVVEYYPGDGRFQNVHTKKWAQLVAEKAAEKRKELHEGSAGDKILERIQTASEMAARPNYDRHYVENTLQNVGFNIDKSFFRNVDKNLQMSVADQLEILERKFNGVTNTQGTMGLLYERDRRGAAVGVFKEPITRSTNLRLGAPFKSWDTMMDVMAGDLESKHCMPFADDSQNRARYMVTHEYGHIMENMFIAEDRERLLGNHSDFAQRYVNQIETIAKGIDQDYSREKYLSRYGVESRKPEEFFAECFANSQMGAPNVLGEAMNKWLKQRGY